MQKFAQERRGSASRQKKLGKGSAGKVRGEVGGRKRKRGKGREYGERALLNAHRIRVKLNYTSRGVHGEMPLSVSMKATRRHLQAPLILRDLRLIRAFEENAGSTAAIVFFFLASRRREGERMKGRQFPRVRIKPRVNW